MISTNLIGDMFDEIVDEMFNDVRSSFVDKETIQIKHGIFKIIREGNSIILGVNLPGYKKENIKVTYDKTHLFVEATEKPENTLHQKFIDKVSYTYNLPRDRLPTAIDWKDGLLIIELEPKDQSNARQELKFLI